jgi:hypothetical protein
MTKKDSSIPLTTINDDNNNSNNNETHSTINTITIKPTAFIIKAA